MSNSSKSVLSGKEAAFLIGFPLTVLFLGYFIATERLSPKEYLDEIVRKEKFSAVVIDKYRDRKNHNNERLRIDLGTEVKVISGSFWKGLYERVEVGDSLSKKSGQSYVEVFRASEFKFKAYFNMDKGDFIVKRFGRRK